MSRKSVFILISAILGLFLICLIAYYFILLGNGGSTSNTPSVFKNFFPFGGNDNVTANPPGTTTNQNPPINPPAENFTQKLRELSAEPVSGAGSLDLKAGTIVRYIEKATGHIYEVEMFSPNKTRISNTTLPLVYDAQWGNKNNSLIARYLKDDNETVDTYGLTLKNSTSTDSTVSGTPFPKNISDVSVFDTSVFYLVVTPDNSSGFVSTFAGGQKKQIWNSPITELNSQFVNSKTVALNTKPYPGIPGYLYLVDTGTGGVKKVLGDVNGLSTLVSPDVAQIIYLSQDNIAKMSIWSSKSKASTDISPATFPEKCVWSKKNTQFVYCAVPKRIIGPNTLINWYQGLEEESDDIWKYDLKTNTSAIIENLSTDARVDIDVIKPFLSQNEQYLVFMNKIDNSLWSLDLTK